MVNGGEEEWRRKSRKIFGEGKFSISIGAEKAKKENIWRRKIFGQWRKTRLVKEKEENILFEKILLRKVGMKMKALQWILKDWEKTEQIKVVGENTRNTPCKKLIF